MTQFDELIAAAEPDRYLASLFAPREKRASLMAIYAFDHEVGRIAGVVQEPMVGHIRLAWWREQIDAIYAGGVVVAPVAAALADAVRAHGLPRDVFEAYLDARGRDFDAAPFEDERYCAAVSGGIMRLGAAVLGGGGEAAAEQAGIAFAGARAGPEARPAAERALARLSAMRLPSRVMPVVSAAATARWMLRHGRAPAPWQRLARVAWANLRRRI